MTMCTFGVLTNTRAMLYNSGLPEFLWAATYDMPTAERRRKHPKD